MVVIGSNQEAIDIINEYLLREKHCCEKVRDFLPLLRIFSPLIHILSAPDEKEDTFIVTSQSVRIYGRPDADFLDIFWTKSHSRQPIFIVFQP